MFVMFGTCRMKMLDGVVGGLGCARARARVEVVVRKREIEVRVRVRCIFGVC